ncbi:sensor histidine kinase [Paenibacillus thalictri]|uniref:histidine kinase n=1 Tax=Paenibacillus thalictri TaxID=2527873 RepID=A0A4Q9DM91_9BACL|nr:sensor histidine kinase [Paenibacillus thalictri]TBL74600.1 sensor histidine kinase [Paenibacillus thalictri]
MKSMRTFHKLSIRAKMVLAFLSLSIASVLLLALSSHYYYSQAVKKDFFNISYEATNRLNYFLDYYFKQFQRSSSTLIESNTIQNWLTDQNYTSENIDDVERELRRYVALNFPEIQNMFLVSRTHNVVSIRESFVGVNNYASESWNRMPLQQKRYIIPTHIADYPGSMGEGVLSIVLPIFGVESLELVGNLVIDISLTEIYQAFMRSKLGQSGDFFILSDNDTIVFHANHEWNGLPISQTGLKDLKLPKDQEATIQPFQGADYLVAAVTSESTHWKIVSMVPFDEMAGELTSATDSMLIILGLIAIFIALMVPFLSAKFVHPILILKNLMRQVAGGNLSVRSVSVPGLDEFQQLNHSFNIMVTRLEELFQTNTTLQMREVQSQLAQKEALIKALQNQINPHLLYNSLGIIQSMAYLEEMPMIEKMAGNLADVYRYTARFSGMETTLREEIIHLQKYLEIIHVRFPSDFQSHLYVNEKFHACPVVKLILQPILENAVKYAIEPLEGKGVIIVSAYDEKNDLVIEIADNGPGIEEEKLHEIEERIRIISTHDVPGIEDGESLGITNVHTRLVLKYGPGYGVRIHSFAGRGTVVSLRMPLLTPLIT